MAEKDADVLVLDPAGHEVAGDEVEERDPEKIRRGSRTPPKRGLCRRCGENKPINRLMLCYPCWVKTRLEEQAKERGEHWHEGMPHPDWCGCSIPGAHENADGSSVGNN